MALVRPTCCLRCDLTGYLGTASKLSACLHINFLSVQLCFRAQTSLLVLLATFWRRPSSSCEAKCVQLTVSHSHNVTRICKVSDPFSRKHNTFNAKAKQSSEGIWHGTVSYTSASLGKVCKRIWNSSIL